MDNNVNELTDQELINTEISTMENMNELLKQDTQNVVEARIEKPTELVEKKLSDFVTDAFNATNKDFAFQEQLKTELLKRVGTMTDNQIIALYSNNSVNLNDRVSKVLGPTFGMIQSKQRAEIDASAKMAQNQIIVNPQQTNVSSKINGSLDGDPQDVSAILTGGNVLAQLFQAIGQSQVVDTTNTTDGSNQSNGQ